MTEYRFLRLISRNYIIVITTVFAFLCSGCLWADIAENSSEAYLRMLKNFEPYAESVWTDHSAIEGAGFFGDGNSTGNGGIRGACGIALAYAVLVDGCPKAPENTRRLQHIEAVLRYATATHLSGPEKALAVDGKKWGHGWQTNLWAGSMGLAAFLMQDRLPPSVVDDCKRVLADEADYRCTVEPASGQHGNTRAEENGWNSNTVALAAAWLKEHPHRQDWLKSARDYLVNTYTIPDDKHGPMAQWISTVNIYPSYMLENHGFYHPSYHMVSGASMGDSYLMAQLADPDVARQLRPFAEHNVMNVWRVLQYNIQDNGEFTFPSGMDWALHSYGQVSYYAFIATHFNDGQAATAEKELIERLLERQKVNGDGRFTGESLKDGFYSEGVRARRIAVTWLHHKANDFKPIATKPLPESFVKHFEDVGIIAQKSQNGFVTVSYSSKIMMLVLPTPGAAPEDQYVIAPQTGSLIGSTPLGTAENAKLIEYRGVDDGFDARLEVSTKKGNVLYSITSRPDAVAVIQVPLTTEEIKPEPSFWLSIENHPLTGGVRHIQTASQAYSVAQMSDRKFEIKSPWCAISKKISVLYGPGGILTYESPSGYNRRGAAVDTLSFMPDSPLKPTYIILLPGRDLATISQRDLEVNWQYTGDEAILTFTSPAGNRISLNCQMNKTIR